MNKSQKMLKICTEEIQPKNISKIKSIQSASLEGYLDDLNINYSIDFDSSEEKEWLLQGLKMGGFDSSHKSKEEAQSAAQKDFDSYLKTLKIKWKVVR